MLSLACASCARKNNDVVWSNASDYNHAIFPAIIHNLVCCCPSYLIRRDGVFKFRPFMIAAIFSDSSARDSTFESMASTAKEKYYGERVVTNLLISAHFRIIVGMIMRCYKGIMHAIITCFLALDCNLMGMILIIPVLCHFSVSCANE